MKREFETVIENLYKDQFTYIDSNIIDKTLRDGEFSSSMYKFEYRR